MTRLDAGPPEVEAPTACEGPEALLLEAREVPLGGVRGMEVHRSLPQRALPMVGAFGGASSPATMYTPIAGVEVNIPAGASITLPLEPAWEYALVGMSGEPQVHTDAEASLPLADQSLLYLGIHRDRVEVTAERDATLFVLGGEPFEADIVMWWNFVARTHEEIVTARDAWEAEGAPGAAPTRFGHVVGHGDERIPAPPLPAVRLTQRRRRP